MDEQLDRNNRGKAPEQPIANEPEQMEHSELEQNTQQVVAQESAHSKQFKVLQRSLARLAQFATSEQMSTLSLEAINIRRIVIINIRRIQLTFVVFNRLTQQWDQLNDVFMQMICELNLETAMAHSYEECLEIMEEQYYESLEIFQARASELETIRHGNLEKPVGGEKPNEPTPIKVVMPLQQHAIPNTWGKYDGSDEKWLSFRDRFTAAICNREGMEESYKLSYLIESLVGRAADTLGKGPWAHGSFEKAWERVIEVHHQPYRIAKTLLRKFYELPKLSGRASAQQLQHMSNMTHETIRQLRALDIPVDGWDFVFVTSLHERLDEHTGRQWELARTSEQPGVMEMTKFLDKEAQASQPSSSISSPAPSTEYRRAGSRQGNSANSSRSTTPIGKMDQKVSSCEACPGNNEYHSM